MPFGKTVRRLRIERGMTLEEVGRATGDKMSAGSVSSVERGRHDNPTDKMLRRFARAFDMTVEELRRESGLASADVSLPPPEERYPSPLRWIWQHLDASGQREVEEHARWVLERRSREGALQPPSTEEDAIPEVEGADTQETDEPRCSA